MDTNAPKTPDPLPYATWQAMTPEVAAREVHVRVTGLPSALRSAALAWLRPEAELTAELAQAQSGGGNVSLLHGIPYLLKDLFDLAGVPTLAGSTFLPQVRPTPATDSAIVIRLREYGAACAGKTHLVEFASGLTGENPHYGDCPHPRFPDRLSGGSSSGSAALVAAGATPLAIGTDTGGSVRVPAAFCGLYGFRLTPREAFICDAFPLAPSMDTAGWFTANPTDLLTTWRALVPNGRANPPDEPSGHASAQRPPEPTGTAHPEDSPYLSTDQASPLGCFLPMSALLPDADPETSRASDAAAAEICPPADRITQSQLIEAWHDAVDAYVTIGMSEANTVHRNWLVPFREHYDPVIWQRFTAAGQYPAEQVSRARMTQQEIWATWRHFFRNYDYLVMPAVPCPAPHKSDCTPELRRQIITLTAPASLGGLPVLSLPVPLSSGLSGGLQIIVPVANSPVIPWLLKR